MSARDHPPTRVHKQLSEALRRGVEAAMHRVIDTPVEAVYAAWTEPGLLCRWLAPGNATVVRAVAEVVVGGTFLIGFGLSSRSTRREDHHPESHAYRFAELLDHLELRDITLFMNNWGGSIGLDFARRHPDRVRRLVITNTWCWPVGDDFHFRAFSFLMSSWVGHLIRHRNLFVNTVMPKAVGDRNILTPEIMAHYRNAQPSPAARAANAALPGYIVGAGDWLRSIWDDRAAFADKPALLLWGLKDIAFRRKELERWKRALPDHDLHEFEECGHFLAEEAPNKVVSALRGFMGQARHRPGARIGPGPSS